MVFRDGRSRGGTCTRRSLSTSAAGFTGKRENGSAAMVARAGRVPGMPEPCRRVAKRPRSRPRFLVRIPPAQGGVALAIGNQWPQQRFADHDSMGSTLKTLSGCRRDLAT